MKIEKNIDIYVDQINAISLFFILLKYSKKNIHKIFYDSYNLPKFLSFFLKQIKIKDINKIPVSFIKIQNKYFYISHWKIINTFLKKIFNEKNFLDENLSFFKKNNINSIKYIEHLKDKAVDNVYLPIKLILFSKKFSKNKDVHFIMSKNPFNDLINNYFNTDIKTYLNPFFHTFKVKKSESSNWGKYPQYSRYHINYIEPKIFYLKRIITFLFFVLKGVFVKNSTNSFKKIGIELLARDINLNDITDLYWLKYSKTSKDNILGLSYSTYDPTSLKILKDLGIKFFHVSATPIIFKDFLKIIFSLPKLIILLIVYRSFKGWCIFQKTYFLIRLFYFNSIYKNLNIKFLFTMADFDDDKFIKLQAIENNDGLSSCSHWSNVSVHQLIYNKCSDIFFTWSPHFTKTYFYTYPYKKTYFVGYPNDHIFKEITIPKNEENEKFIIGFMDNIMNTDLMYSSYHFKRVYKIFFELLDKYPQLKIYTKPKTKQYHEKLIKDSPKMKSLINNGRIVSFFGSGFNIKMLPAKFSSYCNLVVSQGISSAGAEAGFFGIKSFHYDNSELQNINEFSRYGENKVVFHDTKKLKLALEKEINFPNNNSQESKKCHSILDPYQDGNCGIRTAIIIDTIYQNFDTLNNLGKTLDIVEKAKKHNFHLFETNRN